MRDHFIVNMFYFTERTNGWYSTNPYEWCYYVSMQQLNGICSSFTTYRLIYVSTQRYKNLIVLLPDVWLERGQAMRDHFIVNVVYYTEGERTDDIYSSARGGHGIYHTGLIKRYKLNSTCTWYHRHKQPMRFTSTVWPSVWMQYSKKKKPFRTPPPKKGNNWRKTLLMTHMIYYIVDTIIGSTEQLINSAEKLTNVIYRSIVW